MGSTKVENKKRNFYAVSNCTHYIIVRIAYMIMFMGSTKVMVETGKQHNFLAWPIKV